MGDIIRDDDDDDDSSSLGDTDAEVSFFTAHVPAAATPPPYYSAQPPPRPHSLKLQGSTTYHQSSAGLSHQQTVARTTTLKQPQEEPTSMHVKKLTERFLVFTRVLLKYMEQKDPLVHLKVKQIIKDCAEKRRKRVLGYDRVASSMRVELKKVVSEQQWQRAEFYLDDFLRQRAQKMGSQSAQHLTEKKEDHQA